MHAGQGREHRSMSMRVSQALFVPSGSARVQNGVECRAAVLPMAARPSQAQET